MPSAAPVLVCLLHCSCLLRRGATGIQEGSCQVLLERKGLIIFFLSFRSVLNNSLSLSSFFFFCKTTELYIVHYFQCQVFYESKNYFPVFSSDSPICILRNYLLYLFILFQNIVYIGYFKKYYYYLIFWLILDKLQREMPASTKFLPSHSSIV